jgi:ribosomal protein S6--L-glutamate ligase
VYEKLKFDLVGLDIAETHDGYYLLEVNRSPQFVNYLRLSSINLAEILYDYLLNAVDK